MAILYDPPADDAGPDEEERLEVVRAARTALAASGRRAVPLALGRDPLATLARLRALAPSAVLNLVEGLGGEPAFEALGALLCEAAPVPYSGNPPHALALGGAKPRLKALLRRHRIPTPPWITDPADWREDHAPYIVKAAAAHGSLGLDPGALVRTPGEARRRLARLRSRYGGEWFLERYLGGREFHVSLLARPDGRVEVLPIAETVFTGWPPDRPRLVDHGAKWRPRSRAARATPRRFLERPDEAALRRRLARLGRRVWEVCGLAGYARIDFRADGSGEPAVLDVNPNPSLHPTAGFAASAARAGLDYPRLVAALLPPGPTPS